MQLARLAGPGRARGRERVDQPGKCRRGCLADEPEAALRMAVGCIFERTPGGRTEQAPPYPALMPTLRY